MSSDTSKRRRVGEGGSGGDGIPHVGGGHQNDNTSVHQELSEMKSTINELMYNMTNMMQMMQSQSKVIYNMQGDINRLTQKCNSMETSIKQTTKKRFDSVDDKLKYHDILLQNQKWVYSAPRPSADYWGTLEEEEENEAEHFLEQIKKCSEEMRYGTGNGEIVLNTDLSFNQVFLPHWQEFANALEQYHYHINHSTEQRDNSKLHLFYVKLPENVISLLSNALKSTHFSHLILRDNNFGQKGIDFALDYLESNLMLKQFTLVNNPMDDINKLCQIVKEHPSVDGLTLDNCKGGDIDGYQMLKMVINAGKKLQFVDLSNNNISTGGGTALSDILARDHTEGDTYIIADFLVKSTILDSINLYGNELNDNDAFNIAGALRHNKTLRSLNLINNNLTKTGWKALRKAEFDDSSLNSAADSNHTCAIEYPPDGSEVIEGVDTSEMNDNPQAQLRLHPHYIRQKKIYTVLSSRNRDCSNVGHFEDVPVELLPDMSQSIQRYSHYRVGDPDISQGFGDVKPLSIIYEMCRHWEESLAAFETLSLSK